MRLTAICVLIQYPHLQALSLSIILLSRNTTAMTNTNTNLNAFVIPSVNSKRGSLKPAKIFRNPRLNRLPPVPMSTDIKTQMPATKLDPLQITIPSTTLAPVSKLKPLLLVEKLRAARLSLPLAKIEETVNADVPLKGMYPVLKPSPGGFLSRLPMLVHVPQGSSMHSTHTPATRKEYRSKFVSLIPRPIPSKPFADCSPSASPMAADLQNLKSFPLIKRTNIQRKFSLLSRTPLESSRNVGPNLSKLSKRYSAPSRVPVLLQPSKSTQYTGNRISMQRTAPKSSIKCQIPRPSAGKHQRTDNGQSEDARIASSVTGAYPSRPSSSSLSSTASGTSFTLSDTTDITVPSIGDESSIYFSKVCSESSSMSHADSPLPVNLGVAPSRSLDQAHASVSTLSTVSTVTDISLVGILPVPDPINDRETFNSIETAHLNSPVPDIAAPISYALAFRRGISDSTNAPSMRLRKAWIPPIADDAMVSRNPMIQMEIGALRSQKMVGGNKVGSPVNDGGRLKSLAGMAIVSKIRSQWEQNQKTDSSTPRSSPSFRSPIFY
ncbi:hypothetical protein BJ138DRAFT_1181057 [Hygrophoropsis aurantiaca]|uniref:Uncharacterized protein n=1 Tax=Hygrophoropsis aurantiaca TaxID=72124 RepID=A0ACB8A9N2_9AGAM|nr:hypothetical protein BJ138DRAFT_1181057 [Hygrophoropsis aurantiaca]